MTSLDTIAAGLDRVRVEISRTITEQPSEARSKADRARRLAALYARRARWWDILQRASGYRSGVHSVYREAAILARCDAESQVRDWQELADYWSQRSVREAAA